MVLGDLINRRRQYRVAESLVTYLGLGIYSRYWHVLIIGVVLRCSALLCAALCADLACSAPLRFQPGNQQPPVSSCLVLSYLVAQIRGSGVGGCGR